MSKSSLSHFDPTPAVKAAHAAIGAPAAPSWGGYWNWVSATIILAFVLYTAQKGTLGTWVSFFGWNPQAIPTANAAGGQTGLAGSVNSAVNSNPVGSIISGMTGVPPLTISGPVGSWINSLFGTKPAATGNGS